ncbi:hypothetical protein [Oceanospirillum maris]|uniref:hypothetical protein n=1 Tax=Oceanospirillum maris TaxID=64977 RepID=UPI00040FE8DD|nr:hypothetical protein [Oceanospirillum maris]
MSQYRSQQNVIQQAAFFPKPLVKWLLPLSFLLALICYFPAELAWRYSGLTERLPKALGLASISGSIWNAEAVLDLQHQKQTLQLKVGWRLGFSALWQQGYWLAVNMTYPGTSLQLLASPNVTLTGLTGGQGVLSGAINPLLINPLLKRNKAWIDGDITINRLDWRIENARPSFLQGTVIWQGGDTYFIQPAKADRPQLIRYPQLALKAKTDADGVINAIVTTLEQPKALVDVRLNPDGWLSATVFGRLKQAVPDLPVPRKPVEQALIKYKEKLF